MDKKKLEFIIPIVTLIIILFLWHLLDIIFDIDEVILPNPQEISFTILNNFTYLLYHLSITSLESILGFFIGSISSIIVAIIFVYSKNIKSAFYPYAIALKATPIYALAPLLILWFGNGIWAKVVMSALVAFFPVLVATIKGLESITIQREELFKSFGAKEKDIFIHLRFPSSLPFIFPALKTSSTLSVVGATIAEFTGASSGIGYVIVNSSYYLDTSMMFASILFISLFGILFFNIINYIEKKIIFWEKNI